MGHNGGFNPFRDAHGQFSTPQGAGKAPSKGGTTKARASSDGHASGTRVRYAGSDNGSHGPFTGTVKRKLPGGKEYLVKKDGDYGPLRVKASKLDALHKRTAPSAPNVTRGKYSSPTTQRYNPTGFNQALLNGRTPAGFKANTIAYRGKGRDINGDATALQKSRPPR